MGARQWVGMVAVVGVVFAAALAGFATLVPPAGATTASVKCPAAASTSPPVSAGAVQWEFGQLGSAVPANSSVSSSWTRGSGSWSGARASGAICSNDSGGGLATRAIVLSVSGSSKLSPQITKLGLLGVGLVLPVTVTATNDAACPRRTSGSVTLFASYYSVHRDSIVLRFAASCAGHDHVFRGATVHVLIARDGHQVNTTGA